MVIFDSKGNRVDVRWLKMHFGEVRVVGEEDTTEFYLFDTGDNSYPSVRVKVLVDGDPAQDVAVAFSWPDAPVLDGAGGTGKAVIGKTDENGIVGFAYSRDAFYDPSKGGGPHSIWLYGEDVMLVGLGMLMGTQYRHLDIEIRKTTEDEMHTFKVVRPSDMYYFKWYVDPPRKKFKAGEKITVYGAPKPGYTMEGWGGDIKEFENPLEYTMPDHDVTVIPWVRPCK